MKIFLLKKIFLILFIGLSAFLFIFSTKLLFADVIYLKNGSHMEGVIEYEDKEDVQLNLGFGSMTFHRSEIDHVVKSDANQTQEIWRRWGAEQKEIEKRKPEEERRWQERQTELERVRHEAEKLEKEKDEFGPKDIQVTTKEGSIFMNVLLNGKIRATLVLDSGAGTVMLTRQVADKLGIDVEKLKKVNTRVADGRTVQAGSTVLESIKVQDAGFTDAGSEKNAGVESKNVEASFLLEEIDVKDNTFDGLLGMSFLKNFKFNADYKNNKVTFVRLKEENISNP